MILLVPLLGTNFALTDELSIGVDHTGFDDAQGLFGLYITAHIAFTLFGVDIMGRLFEIDDGIHGIAIVNDASTLVDNQQFIDQFIQIAVGLMDVDNDQFPLEHLAFQQHHNFFGVDGGEA